MAYMSEQVRTFINEEMDFLGPMRLNEVEEVQLRIVQQVHQLEKQGLITIVRGETDDQFDYPPYAPTSELLDDTLPSF